MLIEITIQWRGHHDGGVARQGRPRGSGEGENRCTVWTTPRTSGILSVRIAESCSLEEVDLMETSFTVEDGRFDLRLVMNGPWSSEVLDLVSERGIKEIELNYAKGWKGTDYSFLRQLPFLEVVEITDRTTDKISAVNELPGLRYLAVHTYCKTALDFSRWPRLEGCAIEWRPKASSLFQHLGIKRVFINKWNQGEDLTNFCRMTQLESLRLYSPTRLKSLKGIESLNRLTWFELALATRLTSLAGIEALTNLQHLELHTCRKIGNITPVGELPSLKEFHLLNCGDIDTIKPLRGVSGLESFLFYESTNVLDGDLAPLTTLQKLRAVAFMERPHYSHTRKDLQTP